MSSPEYLRYYDDTIVELANRGHEVVVGINMVRAGKPVRLDAIESLDPRVRSAGTVPSRADRWAPLARAVRGTMDFVRYLHPDLADASALRGRVKRQALPWPLARLDRTRALTAAGVARRMNRLARIERAIPVSADVAAFLKAQQPDLVLVSPLIEPVSEQVDIVRAAQALGIRVATLIASWDNLTNKGDIRTPTARIFVWNERQKREAVDLHRVDPASVEVTGSQVFDRWFGRQPSMDREAFCRQVGLPDTGPFVLFTGSSIFIARAEHEMPFVRRWIEALRASADPAVRNLRVLVRPHPYNGKAWTPEIFDDMPNVAVWPRGGYDPIDQKNREGFFDSMFYAEAVVGINTSAMIESAIVGRPVLSIEAEEFAATQGGTLHFKHLLPENGGFLRVASTIDEHVSQLAAILRDPESARAELRRFVGSFIRPFGIDQPVTPRLAAAIEAFGRAPALAPTKRTLSDRLMALALTPLALTAGWFPPEAERKRGPERKVKDLAWKMRKGSRGAVRRLVPRILVIPPLLALGLTLGYAGLDLAGGAPIDEPRPLNVAEAAAMAKSGEVLRFLRQGQDPAAAYPVRADVVSGEAMRLTAFQAAVWSRRGQMVSLLDREGLLTAARRSEMACLAGEMEAAEIAAYFAADTLEPCR